MNKVEMLRPIGFKFKKVDKEPEVLSTLDTESFITVLSYKGRKLTGVYGIKKGDYKQPKLDMTLNSLFNNSYIYRNCDNFFEFADMFGKAFKGEARKVKEMYNHTEKIHNDLLELFGEDFDKYDTFFRALNPLDFMFAHKRR